jgi:hypothetical protein
VHGGLCPCFTYVEQLEFVNRFVELPLNGIILDVLWSDPFDGVGFSNIATTGGISLGERMFRGSLQV